MKILKTIRTVLVWLFAVIAGVVMIFTIIAVSTFDQANRNLFGYKAFIVLSDSMKKTDFSAGDLVLIKEVEPSTLKEGDIIAYISQNNSNFGQTITHKIRRLTTDAKGDPGFVTYGTTTDVDDETVVTYPYILGKYQAHIPKIGSFFHFLKTTPGYLLCIFLPFMLLILLESIRCFGLLKGLRAEHRAQIQAERDQIEADRLEAQRMMQEVLAMKAKMEACQQPASLPVEDPTEV